MNHPHTAQMHPSLDQIFLGIVAIAAGLIACVNTVAGLPLLSDMPALEVAKTLSQNVDLLRDNYLFTIIILGSLAGGAMSYMVFPPKTGREMAFKFLSSGLGGICISPLLATIGAHKFGVDMTGMWALAVSTMVAFLSWSTLQLVDALYQRVALWWVRKQFGANGPLDEPPFERPRSTREESRQKPPQD